MPYSGVPLRRSANSRVLGGVLGGIAEYFDLDAFTLRVTFTVCAFLSAAFPGIIVYLLLFFSIPREAERSV